MDQTTENEPYCGHCGYQLTGLTESSRCPECGKPLVEILQRPNSASVGKRWRSETQVAGVPLIEIATGPYGNQRRGHARAIIAIGDMATGVLALGGVARGVVAFGGVSVGLIAFGGVSLALLLAAGGMGVGGVALGGVSVGGFALGGTAVGAVAQGGVALGHYASGDAVEGQVVESRGRRDPGAAEFFQVWTYSIHLGGPPGGLPRLAVLVAAILVIIPAASAIIVWLLYTREPRRERAP